MAFIHARSGATNRSNATSPNMDGDPYQDGPYLRRSASFVTSSFLFRFHSSVSQARSERSHVASPFDGQARRHARRHQRECQYKATEVAPRGLSKEAAAVYCGCESKAAFDSWVQKGVVPGPIPGTQRWDRKAIDLWLDRASRIASAAVTSDPLAEWKVTRSGYQRGY
jgi:hypothetical protein